MGVPFRSLEKAMAEEIYTRDSGPPQSPSKQPDIQGPGPSDLSQSGQTLKTKYCFRSNPPSC